MISGESASFGLGVASVITWAIAEIPQIITNHNQKSAASLSLAFLLTWILGDLFNLFGCMLEPATLPTQVYVAVLYLATTLILTTQAVYYTYIRPHLKSKKRCSEVTALNVINSDRSRQGTAMSWLHDMYSGHTNLVIQAVVTEKEREHCNGIDTEHVNHAGRYDFTPSSPTPLPAYPSKNSPDELYIISARSLSVYHTPPTASFRYQTPTSDVEQFPLSEPLLGEVKSPRSSSEPHIKTTLCVVFWMILFLGSCHRQLEVSSMNFKHPGGGVVFQVGRRLLSPEANRIPSGEKLADESSGVGSFLGWGMAVLYMSGRLPQICLNFKRGSAEGLNPLMFVFAILGNGTYVASILASSLTWSKLKPNLPWIVDAGGCMLLDTFIVIQFIYFRCRKATQAKKFVS